MYDVSVKVGTSNLGSITPGVERGRGASRTGVTNRPLSLEAIECSDVLIHELVVLGGEVSFVVGCLFLTLHQN